LFLFKAVWWIISFFLSIPIKLFIKILEIIFYIPKTLFNSGLNKKGKTAGTGLIALGGTILAIGIVFDVFIIGIPVGIPMNIIGFLMMGLGKMIANN
jgi:hypothetical protein